MLVKAVKAMNIEELEKLLETNSVKDINDDRTIIDFKNNIEDGNEIGVVLSTIKYKVYEVYIHITIDQKVYSKLLYTTFNNIEDARILYNQYEEYIINYDVKAIISLIKNEKKNEN